MDSVTEILGSNSWKAKYENPIDVVWLSILNSMQLIELHNWLERNLDKKLHPNFLFNAPSARAVRDMLEESQLPARVDSILSKLKNHEDIAIVSMSCRFPGSVNDLDDLWDVLKSKKDLMGLAPLHRWDSFAILASMKREHDEVLERICYGAFLSDDDIGDFDYKLFGISRTEAEYMAPSHRLLLTCAQEALKEAGYKTEDLGGMRVSVFVGISHMVDDIILNEKRLDKAGVSVYDATGTSLATASGRISFTFGLTGPCISIDTACASSLTCMHAAKETLQNHKADICLVLGVNVLSAAVSLPFAVAGMLSSDGKCHSFDQAANGYCRGEGCGAIVLKRLSDAAKDNDYVHAVVKGSATRHCGRTATLTAPSGVQQELLYHDALNDANVSPEDVRFVEAHGTGTILGDPIEVASIANVYGSKRGGRDPTLPLYVSSIKGSMGHLEAAAGMAGLFSAVLALKRGIAPPNAQLRELNMNIKKTIEG